MNFTIVQNPENTPELQQQMAQLAAACWPLSLGRFARNEKQRAQLLAGSFNVEYFTLAFCSGQLVGMAACAPPGARALTLNRQHIRQLLGPVQGLRTIRTLHKEQQRPIPYAAGSGYIEFVGTAPTLRGQGIATALLQAIFQTSGHTFWVLDVLDSNTEALGLYHRLGFAEFGRETPRDPRKSNFSQLLHLKKDAGL